MQYQWSDGVQSRGLTRELCNLVIRSAPTLHGLNFKDDCSALLDFVNHRLKLFILLTICRSDELSHTHTQFVL